MNQTPTFDDMPATEDPVHLLAIADSKVGKSTYAAQAALDGFKVIYVDSDNGRSALRYTLKDHPEARKRVSYLGTNRPVNFMKGLLRSTMMKPFFWMPNRDGVWNKMLPNIPDDEVVWRIAGSEIPKEWVLVGDSWTSTAADALGIGSADQLAELLDGTNQAIYGDANSNLTYICNLLQKAPYHVMILAHGTKYEVYDKPLNQVAGQVKQKDMVLRETKEVPVSCSRPHGETMCSRFNHIGWLYVDNVGLTEIDFMRKPGRVGGGPPNKKEKTDKLRFSTLTHGVPPLVENTDWWQVGTHKSFKEAGGK